MSIFGPNKATVELGSRLMALSAEVADLKSKHKHLELEWEELYDKVRHQMARMSRRAKVDDKKDGLDLEPEIPDDGVDPISRSILRRRGQIPGAK